MAKLLEGKIIAQKIKAGLVREMRKIEDKTAKPLVLASISVGENPAISSYIYAQEKTAQELGIEYKLHKLDKNIQAARLIKIIQKLNRDKAVNGIIVQLPLSKHLDYKQIINFIAVEKDVEGLHPANIGKVLFGRTKIIPCTAAAVMELIKATGVDLYGKSCVIVGHSEVVGKPLSLLLLEKLATVTVCHIATSERAKLEDYIRKAEILIVAVGKPGLIKGSWIRKKAVVIDVGINYKDEEIVGDIEFKQAASRAAFITPVPGGVGPLTVMMLMRNLVEAARLQMKIE